MSRALKLGKKEIEQPKTQDKDQGNDQDKDQDQKQVIFVEEIILNEVVFARGKIERIEKILEKICKESDIKLDDL